MPIAATHDAEVQAYMDDPLIEKRPQPARTTGELVKAFGRFRAQGPTLRLPLLVLHGTGDQITSPEGSRRLVEAAGSADQGAAALRRLLPRAAQRAQRDRDRVMDDIVAWLKARTSR
jgi:acylglycerol lipase